MNIKTLLLVLLFFAFTSVTNFGQDVTKLTNDAQAKKIEKKRERTGIEQTLKMYTVCSFDDGLRISKVDRIQKNSGKILSRQTASGVFDKSIAKGKSEDQMIITDDGKVCEGVSRTDSYRVMVDYQKPDYFANIRVDRSTSEGYKDDKEIVIRWINFLNGERGDSEMRFPQKTHYNGFEAYSVHRREVDVRENELGATVLFDDENKIIVTIYLLNQRPEYRMHKSTGEWKALREKFLSRYTFCVRENLKQEVSNQKE